LIGPEILLVGIIGTIPPATALNVTSGLIAGGVLMSPRKTRGQIEADLRSEVRALLRQPLP